jgi:hypothetical protein
MNPETAIIGLAVVQVLALGAIVLLGWMLVRRGGEAGARLRATGAPVDRIRARASEGVRITRGKSEQIALRGKALGGELSRTWQTTMHLVEEVVHPGRPPVESVTEPIERGRRLAQRLSRLHAAARKAAGSRR